MNLKNQITLQNGDLLVFSVLYDAGTLSNVKLKTYNEYGHPMAILSQREFKEIYNQCPKELILGFLSNPGNII